MVSVTRQFALAACFLLALDGSGSVAVGQQHSPPVPFDEPSHVDTLPLLKIEQAVLPPALVVGPNAQEDLTAYFAAANPELRDRLERIRAVYEAGSRRPYRAITLVAGDAGIGKTFLKNEIYGKSCPAKAVFKLDLRAQYEQWEKAGLVHRQPDLQSADVVLNTLLAANDPAQRLLSGILKSHPASFYVIDSIDEVHPDEYLPTLEQIEQFVSSSQSDFVHVVVFGRPCSFVQYWKSKHAQLATQSVELFVLEPPQFRTTGDLMVSSWNHASFHFGVCWSHPDGTTSPLSLADYAAWSNEGFARSGRFQDVSMAENHEITPQVQHALVQCARNNRCIAPLLRNLAGNAILRGIVAQQVLHNMPLDNHQIMAAYFDAWLERDYESDGRPSHAHPEHVELYLELLEGVAAKYLRENRVDKEGYFVVSDTDRIDVMHGGRRLTFPVQGILDRSGMKHIDPRQTDQLRYRFEPVWLHRFLVEQHNSRIAARRLGR